MHLLPVVTHFRTVRTYNESLLFTAHPVTGAQDAHLVFNHPAHALILHGFKALPRLNEAVGPAKLSIESKGESYLLTLTFDNTEFTLAEVAGDITRVVMERWVANINPHLEERVMLTTR